MSLIASIGALLTAVASLLGNPNIGSDPAILQQAQGILVQASSLAAQVAALPTSTTEIAATSTTDAGVATGTGTGTGTETTASPVVAPAVSQSTIIMPKTISVSFAVVGDDGFVTITNDTGVAVRVKGLNVPGGTVAGITIGMKYGEGFVYPESFTDATGKTFDFFACNGLGSLGMAVVPGNNNLDPCKRKDEQFAKNELRAGETMIVRYTGTPTGVTYQPGSIVEVDSGNDVTF